MEKKKQSRITRKECGECSLCIFARETKDHVLHALSVAWYMRGITFQNPFPKTYVLTNVTCTPNVLDATISYLEILTRMLKDSKKNMEKESSKNSEKKKGKLNSGHTKN